MKLAASSKKSFLQTDKRKRCSSFNVKSSKILNYWFKKTGFIIKVCCSMEPETRDTTITTQRHTTTQRPGEMKHTRILFSFYCTTKALPEHKG